VVDPFAQFKQVQREGWSHFTPLETFTTPPAARLVRFAGVRAGDRALDVACGTGVVALTAARLGAQVTALDLTPELLVRGRQNAELAGVDVSFHEGDVEALPFEAGRFDVVLSQYGHMFAPRPDVAVAEMLRVLRPGGTIAFSTWPPELFVGRTFSTVARYMPPPPPGAAPPPQWGDPNIVRERLGDAVSDLRFDRGVMWVSALSPAHFRSMFERTAGPVIKLVEHLSAADPAKLADFRREFESLVAEYHDQNVVQQGFLLSRATKR
jgi:SAM-dependent methyltransferase